MGRATNKPSISQRIANLPFVETVDVMLLEGTTARDVAKFIQDDQGSLTDIPFKSLANALAERKRNKELEFDYLGDGDGEGERLGDWFDTGPTPPRRREVKTPSTLARAAYERTKGGIDELVELEAMYLTQRNRVDRLVELEGEKDVFSDKTGKEIAIAIDCLMKRATVKEMMGLIGQQSGEQPDLTDFEGYSKETAEVLSNPESRHRIISLMERIKKFGAKGLANDQEAGSGQDRASGE